MDILKEKIPINIYDKLLEANIDSVKMILLQDELSFCQLTKLSFEEAKLVIGEAAPLALRSTFKPGNYNITIRTLILPQEQFIALEVPDWPRLRTGCNAIDDRLRGGVPINGVVEIAGASGVGKTQFCLQLSLTVQFPARLGGLGRGCVYLCTEDVFPSRRLNELARKFPLQFTQLEKMAFESNIYVQHISDYEQIRRYLNVQLPILLQQRSIGLIIIDSIAGIFRSENEGINYNNRSQEFLEIAYQLNKLQDAHNVAIVCTNQVASNVETGKNEPCLGFAWGNLVTCRFELKRRNDGVRLFEVLHAPDLPNTVSKFVIKDCGICEDE